MPSLLKLFLSRKLVCMCGCVCLPIGYENYSYEMTSYDWFISNEINQSNKSCCFSVSLYDTYYQYN